MNKTSLFINLLVFTLSPAFAFATAESFTCNGLTQAGYVSVNDLVMDPRSKSYSQNFLNLQIAIGESIFVLQKSKPNEIVLFSSSPQDLIFIGKQNKYKFALEVNLKEHQGFLSAQVNNETLISKEKIYCESSN